jgi:hypothetical protein
MSKEDLRIEKPDVQQAFAPDKNSGRAQAIYLVATALATVGWFWFIGWCALQLV